MFKISALTLEGVYLIEPHRFDDHRGYFSETFRANDFAVLLGKHGMSGEFVQENQSFSHHNVLRGLHAQHLHPQGKLIRVLDGEIFDVVVDMRLDSPTFGRSVSCLLSSDNACQLLIPPGFAHGFYVTSAQGATVIYKCTDYYHPGDEIVIQWNDPELEISWPSLTPVLSAKDGDATPFSEVKALLIASQAQA